MVIEEKINMEILNKIFGTQSTSGNSSLMELTVMNILSNLGIDYYMDAHGNIYGYSSDYTEVDGMYYPLLTAHLDTVHDIVPNYKVQRNNDIMYATNGKKQVGIGGDDKSGIILILSLLASKDHSFKFVFFRDEEIGFIGSGEFDLEFAEDVSFIIGIDRKGNSDIMIGSYPQTVGDDVLEYLNCVDEYEVVDDDTFTDSVMIGEVCGISAINISCGYYNPHTATEYISIEDTKSAYRQLSAIMDAIPYYKVFECDYDSYTGMSGYGGYNTDAYDERYGSGYASTSSNYSKDEPFYQELGSDDSMSEEALNDYYEEDGFTAIPKSLSNKLSVFDGTYGTDFVSMLSYCTYVEEFLDTLSYIKESELEFSQVKTLKIFLGWS